MKELLKNQAGAAILVVILVIVLATAGGGVAFLTTRMLVSGDGNFLQPFEELGWIDSNDDSTDEDKSKDDKDKIEEKVDDDLDEEDDDDDTDTDITKTVGSKTKYLVENSRLSSASKKSNVKHYYGEISLTEKLGADDEDNEYADLYKLMKAGVNLYAVDGKAVEIEFGFDITDFCNEAFKKYKDELATAGIKSSDDLVDMMMSMIETTFDTFDEEYSDYINKYVDGGKLQLYVTEKGFESLYETYNIEDGEKDIDNLIDSLEDALNTKISLVKD